MASRIQRIVLAAIVIVATLTVVPAAVAPSASIASAPCENTPTGGTAVRSPYAPDEVEAAMAAGSRVGDNPRSYLLYVPQSVQAGEVPLVVTIHGLLGNARQHFDQTQWATAADRHGFVVVAPNGRRNWDNGIGGIDDDFIRDVVADARLNGCIDARRIYVTGHSNGGFMTHAMACAHADLFAAGASYAAGDVENKPQGGPCSSEGDGVEGWEPMPLGLWHGTTDTIVDYHVGRRGLTNWLSRYDCDTPPESVTTDPYGSTEIYTDCSRDDVLARQAATGQRFTVSFRTFDDHGHAWPDGCGGQNAGTGGAVECDPSENERPYPTASELAEELWAFLSQYSRANPAPAQSAPMPDPPSVPDEDDTQRWVEDGIVSGMDSAASFTRLDRAGAPSTGQPAVQTAAGVELRLRFDVATGGDAAGIGPSHPVCPTANPGPSTQTMAGRAVTLSMTDTSTGETSSVVVTSVVTDGVEYVEAVLPRSSRSKDALLALRARFEGTALKWWWVCGTPPAFYKETVPVCVEALAGPRRCLGRRSGG